MSKPPFEVFDLIIQELLYASHMIVYLSNNFKLIDLTQTSELMENAAYVGLKWFKVVWDKNERMALRK